MKCFAKTLAVVASVALAPVWAQDTTGVTKDTIKIGMFSPLTGSNAVGSKPMFGAAAVYKDVNEKGGIHGRKIELVTEDDACDPNKGIAAVKKLIHQDQVFLLHGGWCSGVVLAIKPELAKTPNVPFVVLGAASMMISNPLQANVFQPVATTATVAQAMVDFALTTPGGKRIAIISHSDEWGKSHLAPALAALKAKGLEPVETVYFERGSTDATSQTLRLRQAKPDAVLAVLYPAELAIYMRDAYKYGLRVPTLGTQGVSIEDTDKRVGIPGAVSNLFVFYPLSNTIDTPEFKPWVDIFRKHNPSESVETLSFISMTGALAVVEAIRRAGPDLTREKVMAELNKLQNFNPGIQSSSLSFSPTDHAGIKTGKMVYLRDGKPRIVATYPAK